MQIKKIFNEAAGKVNELQIAYSPRVDTYTHQMLGLKNQFLSLGKALQDVSGLTPTERIRPGGPDTVTRTAKHIIHGSIKWADVLRVLDDLAASGKLQLTAEKRDLMLYLLKEALYTEAGLSYKTE
jgi:hypothetical protein